MVAWLGSLLVICGSLGGQTTPADPVIGGTLSKPKTVSFRGLPLNEFQPGTCYVLEFWGTWCGPCRTAIPHLNQLVSESKGKNVQFFSVALGDTKATLEKFLEKNQLNTNIVLDDRQATSRAYNIHIVPRTILVGSDGKVAAVTDPEKVTKEVIDKLVSGKPLSLPMANLKVADFDWMRKLPATAKSYVWIEETDSASSGFRLPPGKGELSGDGLTSRTIAMVAYNTDFSHLDWRVKDEDNTLYRIAVKAPTSDDDKVREMLKPLLGSTFGLAAEWREVPKEVYVLSADPAKKLNFPPIEGEGIARGGEIEWPSASSAMMANLIGNFCVNGIVVDETGFGDQKYPFKLKWVPGDKASAISAVESLGLKLTRQTRPVKMLVVESIPKKG